MSSTLFSSAQTFNTIIETVANINALSAWNRRRQLTGKSDRLIEISTASFPPDPRNDNQLSIPNTEFVGVFHLQSALSAIGFIPLLNPETVCTTEVSVGGPIYNKRVRDLLSTTYGNRFQVCLTPERIKQEHPLFCSRPKEGILIDNSFLGIDEYAVVSRRCDSTKTTLMLWGNTSVGTEHAIKLVLVCPQKLQRLLKKEKNFMMICPVIKRGDKSAAVLEQSFHILT